MKEVACTAQAMPEKTAAKMFGVGRNGSSRTKRDFGRLYPVLPQNKAKICPIIVAMPTGSEELTQQSD
jgi:hypothetical protein